jgi:hypothetical protein
MITPSQFDKLSVPISDLYEEYTQSVINDMARRLVSMDMTSTAAWQMQRLIESGMTYQNALTALAQVTGKSEVTLRRVFTQAGVKAMEFDDSIYRAVGLNPIPLHLSPAMRDVLLAGLRKTSAMIHNLTMTTAVDAEQKFTTAADLAYMQVTHGVMSYGQAIRMGIKNLARQGLETVEFKGHRDQLDVAMRRTVLTGVAQTTGVLQTTRADEMGTDLVQTSAHIGARPTHAEWQGEVFSRSGSNPKYRPFSVTGYGTMLGLCGINCRHSWYPFFEGLSENAYKQATLDEYADAEVTYNGKVMSVYQATQKQRAVEREIRLVKREASALAEGGQDNAEEVQKVRDLQVRMRDFINQTGLDRQSSREGGRIMKKSITPEIVYRRLDTGPNPFYSKQYYDMGGMQYAKSFYNVDEVHSVIGYKNSSYNINTYLRTGKYITDPFQTEEDLKRQVKLLDSGIFKSIIDDNIVTFRGMSHEAVVYYGNLKPGNVISDKAFLSTTPIIRQAWGWGSGGDVNGAIFEIRLPAGTHGLFADLKQINDRGENEIILPRGLKLKVISSDVRSLGFDPEIDKYTHIVVEIVK